MPVRVQRKRVKGWKMPENTVCVTRGTYFGNPFAVGGYYSIAPHADSRFNGMSYVRSLGQSEGFIKVRDNEHAIEMYKEYLAKFPLSQNKIAELKGKNLACFCPLDKPCHADILLEIANR